MNWEHLWAFLWLQWRLRTNQLRRAGALSVIISAIISVGMVLAGAAAFVVSVIVGAYALGGASPTVLMFVWDGIAAGFLFFWMIGLLAELQRSEVLSLDKFLHLPVSLNSVFLINYLGTVLCPTVAVFLPGMIGLSIGLVWSKGAGMLWLFPMVAGFVFVVTTITHQFQGWLAALMVNKRRRRTVITVATMVFILLVQLPNILRFASPSSQPSTNSEMRKELEALDQQRARDELTQSEYKEQNDAIRAKFRIKRQQENQENFESAERVALVANTFVPLGWLAYGARASAQGDALPALLGALGLTLLGSASLWRSYRTTLRLYTGQFSSSKPRQQASAPAAAAAVMRASTTLNTGLSFMEKQLPWLSEQASAITLAGFRSIVRAPEAKMLLLTPIIMVVIFGGMLFRGSANPPEFLRPLYVSGAILMILFSLIQLAGNQFGFDRSGFRTFVLSPASRKDILLAKNLALMPLALGMAAIVIGAMQFAYPMRIDHFLAILVQTITMYLAFALVANVLSILTPMPIASGSLKPAGPKGVFILIQFAFLFVFPLALSPALIPLGIEFLLMRLGYITSLPVCLLLTLLELALTLYLYPHIVAWQGTWLHSREQRILESVTAKVQ